ncbi:Hydroxyproline O-arabinosyltransferase 1 [Camellia lanceoleosa]|uniref:Hydroxyproline O-arabinosyltransferase 1 n=1 Tax=Camellia lanceoleosa TaxID=1840588 RepID=A0ACC0FCJ7_9ERIC|nr:Hydroxyproline O-arabinosyltransferase 1 [Camellia lanceoleosa]
MFAARKIGFRLRTGSPSWLVSQNRGRVSLAPHQTHYSRIYTKVITLFFFFGVCGSMKVLLYDELWMPLISDLTVGSTSTHHPPMILPPIDIQWVWFCHTFNPIVSQKILLPIMPWFLQQYKPWTAARIMYYWFKQFKDGPNSEMGGFTRILHSGKPNSFMDEIPTFVAQPLPTGTD